MAKINRHGQSATLSEIDRKKIYRNLTLDWHRLILKIAFLTGERWGAIRRLQVSDCYISTDPPLAREEITFRASSRKASPDGKRETRQIPMHPELKAALEAYTPPHRGFLFPSPVNQDKPVSHRACDKLLRIAIAKSGLAHKGISTHSSRRTFITEVARKTDVKTLQKLTGHKSTQSLLRYVEDDPERQKEALESIYF